MHNKYVKFLRGFLDAIAFFLDDPSDTVAVSLALTDKEARIVVSSGKTLEIQGANASGTIDKGISPRNPKAVIEGIWPLLQQISATSASNIPESKKKIMELVRFIFDFHHEKMQALLEPKHKCCERFLEYLSKRVREENSTLNWSELNARLTLVKVCQDVFNLNRVFLGGPEERTEVFIRTYLKTSLKLDKSFTEAKKKSATMQWLSRHLKAFNEGMEAEKSACLPILSIFKLIRRPFTAASFSGTAPFDLLPFMDSLLSPAIHLKSFQRVACHRIFTYYLRIPVQVHVIYTEHTAKRDTYFQGQRDWIFVSRYISTIRAFLESAYDLIVPDLEGTNHRRSLRYSILSAALTLKDVHKKRERFELTPTLQHCVCSLIQYHHQQMESDPHSTPYSYIGVSKVPCSQCGIYLKEYRRYAQKHGDMALPRYHTRTANSQLPSWPETEWRFTLGALTLGLARLPVTVLLFIL